jgi:hypothetical protein
MITATQKKIASIAASSVMENFQLVSIKVPQPGFFNQYHFVVRNFTCV